MQYGDDPMEHDHSYDPDEASVPLDDGHHYRLDPDDARRVQMQCLFCQDWMPCEMREYGSPAVTINPDSTAQLVYTADFQLRAIHECTKAEEILGDVMRAHVEEHHR